MAQEILNIQSLDFSACPDLVQSSIDTDGSLYNGCGYQSGCRLNSSGTTTTYDDHYVTGYIPIDIASGAIVLFEGNALDYIHFCDEKFNFLMLITGTSISNIESNENKILTLNTSMLLSLGKSIGNIEPVTYIRVSTYKTVPIVKILNLADVTIKI